MRRRRRMKEADGLNGKGIVVDPTRNVEIAVFTNTPSVSRLRPQSSPTPSIFVHGYASLRCE